MWSVDDFYLIYLVDLCLSTSVNFKIGYLALKMFGVVDFGIVLQIPRNVLVIKFISVGNLERP